MQSGVQEVQEMGQEVTLNDKSLQFGWEGTGIPKGRNSLGKGLHWPPGQGASSEGHSGEDEVDQGMPSFPQHFM